MNRLPLAYVAALAGINEGEKELPKDRLGPNIHWLDDRGHFYRPDNHTFWIVPTPWGWIDKETNKTISIPLTYSNPIFDGEEYFDPFLQEKKTHYVFKEKELPEERRGSATWSSDTGYRYSPEDSIEVFFVVPTPSGWYDRQTKRPITVKGADPKPIKEGEEYFNIFTERLEIHTRAKKLNRESSSSKKPIIPSGRTFSAKEPNPLTMSNTETIQGIRTTTTEAEGSGNPGPYHPGDGGGGGHPVGGNPGGGGGGGGPGGGGPPSNPQNPAGNPNIVYQGSTKELGVKPEIFNGTDRKKAKPFINLVDNYLMLNHQIYTTETQRVGFLFSLC